MLYYSPSTSGFYDSELSSEDRIPADATEITPDLHAQLLAGQSIGKRIVTDKDGRPALADPLPPSPERLRLRFQGEARAELQASDLVVLRCYESGVPFPVEWAIYRESLREIIRADAGEVSQQLPLPPDYPAL